MLVDFRDGVHSQVFFGETRVKAAVFTVIGNVDSEGHPWGKLANCERSVQLTGRAFLGLFHLNGRNPLSILHSRYFAF
jgi:hypothetical protein